MILISAGHNPDAPGACFDDFCEHDEAMKWAENIILELDYLDISAALVPTGSLGSKVRWINQQDYVIAALEIHFNAAMYRGKPTGIGCETLYCPKSQKGEILAGAVQKYLWPLFTPNRGIKEGWYKMDRPDHEDYPGDIDGDEKPDYFLLKTKCPAIIVEPQFIQHKDDIQSKRISGSRQIAHGIIEGIEGIEAWEKSKQQKNL